MRHPRIQNNIIPIPRRLFLLDTLQHGRVPPHLVRVLSIPLRVVRVGSLGASFFVLALLRLVFRFGLGGALPV